MTPEREAYEQALADYERQAHVLHSKIAKVLGAALDADLVITLNTKPCRPLAMGNYDMLATVRPSRERSQRLLALEAAAKASEAS